MQMRLQPSRGHGSADNLGFHDMQQITQCPSLLCRRTRATTMQT